MGCAAGGFFPPRRTAAPMWVIPLPRQRFCSPFLYFITVWLPSFDGHVHDYPGHPNFFFSPTLEWWQFCPPPGGISINLTHYVIPSLSFFPPSVVIDSPLPPWRESANTLCTLLCLLMSGKFLFSLSLLCHALAVGSSLCYIFQHIPTLTDSGAE